jgi:arylsulfatase A-like enzyme
MDTAQREGKPFFLWYAPMMPHHPHTPPERLLAKYRAQTNSLHVARYWAMVEWFDETCGQLLDYLERKGLAKDTLVVYVADNGWIQPAEQPRFAPKSKQSPYDGGLRTPILVRWPGRVSPETSGALASSIDLAPTILRACGVEPPSDLPGIDLRQAAVRNSRSAIFGACYTHDAIDLDQPSRSLRWRWCVVEGWKLIVPNPAMPTNGVMELYQIRNDPQEMHNVAPSETNRVTMLVQMLDQWWDGR